MKHKAIACKYCGREYVKPCNEKKRDGCANWLFKARLAQQQGVKKKSKPRK